MKIDLPEVVAEMKKAFERYEQALVSNDVTTLDSIFRRDERTIRYGIAENLHGYKEVTAFRASRLPVNLMRSRLRTVITTYGRDFAVASTLFHRDSLPGKVGGQMRTWVRFAEGWRVVAAHVNLIKSPKARERMARREIASDIRGRRAAYAQGLHPVHVLQGVFDLRASGQIF